MATFTMELWEVLELSHDPGFEDPASDDAGKSIALNTYPIFADNHRRVLNEKILEHYWDREIGMETISKFRLAMKRRLNEIMPYYNKLYQSELIAFDPLATFGLTTTREDTGASTNTQAGTSHEAVTTGTTGTNHDVTTTDMDGTSHEATTSGSTATNTSSSRSKSQQSDTPQNELPDNWEENADYATSGAASQAASDGTAATTGTNTTDGTTGTTGTVTVDGTNGTTGTSAADGTTGVTGSGTNTLNGTSSTTGFQGSAADLLGKFRAQILNIDLAIVNDLNGLFMGIWDSGDEMLPVRVGVYGGVSRETFRPFGDPLPDMAAVFHNELGA